MSDKRRILGIDPGSRVTGFGVLDFVGDKPDYVASGTVRTSDTITTTVSSVRKGSSGRVAHHRGP